MGFGRGLLRWPSNWNIDNGLPGLSNAERRFAKPRNCGDARTIAVTGKADGLALVPSDGEEEAAAIEGTLKSSLNAP
jgi:hypothetical protein